MYYYLIALKNLAIDLAVGLLIHYTTRVEIVTSFLLANLIISQVYHVENLRRQEKDIKSLIQRLKQSSFDDDDRGSYNA